MSVPGKPYESVSPLVKAILAFAATGDRYRLGHYGAITKVRARGNVTGNGNLTILVAESHEAETQSVAFSLGAFQEADSAEIWLRPDVVWVRMAPWPITGRVTYCAMPDSWRRRANSAMPLLRFVPGFNLFRSCATPFFLRGDYPHARHFMSPS